MTPDDLIQQIDQGSIGPLYFLYGEETFYHTEIIHALLQKQITPDNRDFNLETFDAKDSAVQDWLAAAKTLSFMGGTKVVIVKNLHDTTLQPKETEALLGYANDPVADTCLILTATKADRKKKIFKSLIQFSWAVNCQAPKESLLFAWIKKRATSLGVQLSSDAARLMVERTGPKPGVLAKELEKVITYSENSASISEENIREVVGDIKVENAFELTEALKERNAEKAIRLLHNQLDHGEDPIKVLGTMVWQFRVIWEVKRYRAQKLPAIKIAQEMGSKPFLVEKAMKCTENFSQQDLIWSFENLAQADRELKSSGNSPQGILESLILKLCCGKN